MLMARDGLAVMNQILVENSDIYHLHSKFLVDRGIQSATEMLPLKSGRGCCSFNCTPSIPHCGYASC